jgi:hypothetical protein
MPNTNLHTSHSPHHNVNVTSHPCVAVTPVAVPAVAIPVAVPIAILFAVPVLSPNERQEQRDRIGRTSFLEKRLIIIQQLIVINEG